MNIAWRAARVIDSQALAGEFADHRELDRRTESLTVNVHGPFVLDDWTSPSERRWMGAAFVFA